LSTHASALADIKRSTPDVPLTKYKAMVQVVEENGK